LCLVLEVDEKEVSISEKQKFDKDLTLIRKWVEKGEKTELKEITGESITVKSMWAQFDQLTIRRTKHKATSVHFLISVKSLSDFCFSLIDTSFSSTSCVSRSCMFLTCCARFSVFPI
jgi:hypothetical protein